MTGTAIHRLDSPIEFMHIAASLLAMLIFSTEVAPADAATVATSSVESGFMAEPCSNLASIGTGTVGTYWQRAATATVKQDDGSSTLADVTSYVATWSAPGGQLAWPGIPYSTVQVAIDKNLYIAEEFTVPVDGSVTGNVQWTNAGQDANGKRAIPSARVQVTSDKPALPFHRTARRRSYRRVA